MERPDFAENRFVFSHLSVVPGARIEFFQQSLVETLNITKPVDELLSKSDFSTVPLFALGLDYVLIEGEQTSALSAPAGKGDAKEMKNVASTVTSVGPPRVELYATVAQAYRPLTYGDLVPTSADGVVNGDLKEGRSLQFELGVVVNRCPYLTYDVSGFYFTFNDQVGEITGINSAGVSLTRTENVGDARFLGLEAATELDVLALFNGGTESPYGQFNFYGNVTLLDAEFTSGPADGFRPPYASNYLIKVGGIYRWKDVVKVGLLGTLVDETFADANNTPERFIPSYNVWDLTTEVNLPRSRRSFRRHQQPFRRGFLRGNPRRRHCAGIPAELLRRLQSQVLARPVSIYAKRERLNMRSSSKPAPRGRVPWSLGQA